MITPDDAAPIAKSVHLYAQSHGITLKEAFRQLRVGVRRLERAGEASRPSAEAIAVLRAIAELRDETGLPPTLREIAAKTGRSYATVKYHLEPLKEFGLATWRPNQQRTILVTASGMELLAAKKAA